MPTATTSNDQRTAGSLQQLCSAAFPIMEGGARRAKDDLTSIPWAMIAPHDATARQNHGGQTLVRLAQRGGLCPLEAVAVLQDMDYRKRWPQMMHSRDEQEKLTLEARAILKEMVSNWTPPNSYSAEDYPEEYWEDEETCEMCGGDGVIEYLDHPEVWGEDCPSYQNHLLPCPECRRRELAERRKANPPNGEPSQADNQTVNNPKP